MSAPPTKPGGFSLYADLLNDSDKTNAGSTTISSAPVKYDLKRPGSSGTDDEKQQKRKDASLQFQPIKRPQVQKKGKPKAATSSSSTHKSSSSSVTAATASSPNQPRQPSTKRSTFEDWVGDDNEELYWQDNRQRGGKKNKKKVANKPYKRIWSWDDTYDPTFPNKYAEYNGSDEQQLARRDWKARLYYHRTKAEHPPKKIGMQMGGIDERAASNNTTWAPPSGMSFAPPSFDDPIPRGAQDDEYDDDYQYPAQASSPERPSMQTTSTPTLVADDPDGESAYLRRMQMSGIGSGSSMSPPVTVPAFSPPSAAQGGDLAARVAAAKAKAAALTAHFKKTIPAADPSPPAAIPPSQPVNEPILAVADQRTSVPPMPIPPPPPIQQPGAIISRAPVRYELPPAATADNDGDTAMAEGSQQIRDTEGQLRSNANREETTNTQSRSKPPAKKNFGERMLQKYGWSKGKGLGASGDGITTAIVAQAEKRPKKRDANSHSTASLPSSKPNMGRIVGGKRQKQDEDDAPTNLDPRFGKMSEVIKLGSILDGLDVQREIEDNNLMQEIGDEMGQNYGTVERVFIWRKEMGGGNEVFVKFTGQLSALRAVNGMEGSEFAGNRVTARFWDGEMFEKGEYA